MGANGSSRIEVNFNRPDLFYFGGDQVSGDISFHNSQGKIIVNAVLMEFIGEMGFTTEELRPIFNNDGTSRTEKYTEQHAIPFITIRFPVAQPQYGQREITLYRGQHSWPFTFVLPHSLPPTLLPAMSSGLYPYIKYYARVVLEQSCSKPNPKEVYPLTVFPRVNLLNAPGGQEPVAFQNRNRKKIVVQGYLVQGGVVPGGKLFIQIDLQNPKRVTIKRIEAILNQHRQAGESSHTQTICRLDLPDLHEFTGVDLHQTFELSVPAESLSPSYTYLSQRVGAPVAVSVTYQLILYVRVRGLFTDFKISVPVLLGTEPTSDELQKQQQHYMSPPIAMPVASAPVMDYGEAPPSYEAVVSDWKM